MKRISVIVTVLALALIGALAVRTVLNERAEYPSGTEGAAEAADTENADKDGTEADDPGIGSEGSAEAILSASDVPGVAEVVSDYAEAMDAEDYAAVLTSVG